MKKIVRLTESDLLKIVQKTKKNLREFDEPEPVFTNNLDSCSIPTIKKFHNDTKFDLPQLVTFYVGTSSTGSFATNKKVAERRMSYLTDLYLEVMNSFGIREDVAYKLLVQSNKAYTPSKIDRDFYDPAKVKPNSAERICSVIIKPITTKGLTGSQIGNVQGGLIDNSSIINTFLVDNVDEEGIVNGIKSLETYSDIKDLNQGLINARKGTLQNFLNDQLFDDSFRKQQVILHLNKIGKRSGKNTIATIVGPEKYISIILENKKKVTRLTESELFKLIKKIINEETNTLK